MKIRFTLFTFCLILQINNVAGQVPGYLGKRLFVNAYATAMPALKLPTASNGGLGRNYGEAENRFDISTRFGGQIGYVTSRKNALTFSGEFFKTGLIYNAVTPSLTPTAGFNAYDNHYLFYNLNGITADIGYQVYSLSRGALAPMGRYFSYHLSYTILNGSVVDKRTELYDDNMKTHAKFGINPKYGTASIGLEWGLNSIFADRFLVNVAFNTNLSLGAMSQGSFSYESSPSDFDDDYIASNQANFNRKVAERMLYHALFSLKIGIGLLP
jgi:hypothetical protein